MFQLYMDTEFSSLRTTDILSVVGGALSKIDVRLIDHGKRVAYIADCIRRESRDRTEFEPATLFSLCLLHDIGAYKTDEIDNMVRFETDSAFEHSLYGYLFLKNTTQLSERAEAILYHHTDYSSPVMQSCRYAKYAQLIHLADRVDILAGSGVRLGCLRELSGGKFSPEYVDAFFRAEEKYGIIQNLASGGFLGVCGELLKDASANAAEAVDYLRLLVYAIDFRSPYTVTHTADTTIISIETGKLMGLSDRELQALYIGAFLHDIGKIAIPHDVLEKNGKLTPEEFDIVKRHIPEGENILRGIVSDEISDIALRHHEKLDGSGYSRGLTASELSVPQRIVAVADIMSALSQKRSYKEAFPKEQVVGILNDMKRDGRLCPDVVDTVCENYDTILANTEHSHDPVKTLYRDIVNDYARLKGSMAGTRY